jgi:hypothetical protein
MGREGHPEPFRFPSGLWWEAAPGFSKPLFRVRSPLLLLRPVVQCCLVQGSVGRMKVIFLLLYGSTAHLDAYLDEWL